MKVLNSNYNRVPLYFVLILIVMSCTKPERTLDLQGHRGARGLFPENSMPAFEYALSIPEVTTLELDVVVSKDKQLIISHEPWMNAEICTLDSAEAAEERAVNLYELTAEEIRSYDCGSKGNARFPEQKKLATYKPTLSELFNMLGRTGRWPNLNIETKCTPAGDGIYHPTPKEFAQLIHTFIERYNALNLEIDLNHYITIQSFDVRTLQELRKLQTGVKLCLLTEDDESPEAAMDRLGFPADIFSPNYETLTQETINWCHFRRISVIPWTVNEVEDMQRLVDMGVDGIISDYPNKFRELVY